ncbi:MAG: glycosyltransferase family 4 protein [Microthrixaceae bacterium]
MIATDRPRLVHVTTTDISLELLLGPQLSAFVAAGYEVFGLSAPGPFVERIEARGVTHLPLANATRAMAPHRDLLALGELRSTFRRLRPTIVHTHNPKPGVYGRLAARAARVPVVVNTVHGLYALPGDRLRKRAVVYGLERIAATCSDAELVQNPEDLDTLRHVLRIPASRLVLLGNGIDLNRFGAGPDDADRRAGARAALGIDDDAVVVGAVGRLVAEKGYPELFEAWRTVRTRHPRAVLVVAGPDDADKADALDRATVAAATEDGVRFLGMRDDVEELYRAFDLYVLASHREGFPRSAMEAAAAGLPIVATDIRGCRQVVDDGVTGILVPPRAARELAGALDGLLADDDRRRAMSVAAAARAVAEFDQERVISTTLTTYDRLLRATGTRG